MGQRFLFMVRSQPVRGEDQSFARFYDEQHVPDLLAVPGVVSARRYTLLSGPEGWTGASLGLYEIEADDLDAVMAEMARRYGTEAMPRSDSVDSASTLHFTAVEAMPARRAAEEG